jgi:hypothetical protein
MFGYHGVSSNFALSTTDTHIFHRLACLSALILTHLVRMLICCTCGPPRAFITNIVRHSMIRRQASRMSARRTNN